MQKKKRRYSVLCILSEMFLRNSEVNPCSKTITNENCPFHPSPRLNDYLVSRRHKKSLHSTYTCPSVCLYMCLLCHDSPSVFSFSPIKLHPSPFQLLLLTDRLRLMSPTSGLPLSHRLRASVQLAPPRRGGCAAVAQGTLPVRGDFLFASPGFFVTQCDVAVRRWKESIQVINRKSARFFREHL